MANYSKAKRGSQATVNVWYEDRYLKLQTWYESTGGRIVKGRPHRVYLMDREHVGQAWEVLFDEVLHVKQEQLLEGTVMLRIDPNGMNGMRSRVETMVDIVAQELKVNVDRRELVGMAAARVAEGPF